MKRSSLIKWFSLLIATGCMLLASLTNGSWELFIPIVCTLGAWFYFHKSAKVWLAHLGLTTYLGTAAFGSFTGPSPILPVVGCFFAIICWDLFIFTAEVAPDNQASTVLSAKHIRSLCLMLVFLPGAIFGLLNPIRMGFLPILIISSGIIMALGYTIFFVKNKYQRRYPCPDHRRLP